MSYQSTIEYLYGLQKQGIKFGLANSALLMELLGEPHRKFRSIHIAGTNGKGSTAAFTAAMLQAAGLRVGLYTSPHLVSFTERIRINNVPVSEAEVISLAERVRSCSAGAASPEGGPLIPTFFEVTTAMAFRSFAEQGVDIAVVEAGMGGRLDSTNVITPLVSVITNIDVEHTEYLGATVAEIAFEKAGVIKPGVPVVTGAAQPEAVGAIERAAAVAGSTVRRMPRDFGPEAVTAGREQGFDYRGIAIRRQGLRIGMLGRHQIGNACLALAALECATLTGTVVPDTALRAGLAAAAWEGRLERVAERPDVFLDGAHNPASARVLAEAVRSLRRTYRRVVIVLGVLADKDYRGIVAQLAPQADRLIVTRPDYGRALDAAALAAEAAAHHRDVVVAPSVTEAIEAARGAAAPEDLIVITGSLYTVGDARALLLPAAGAGPLTALKG